MGEPSNATSTHFFAPSINSISLKAKQDFLANREAYEDAKAAQLGMKTVPYRSCFATTLLKSLICARVFVTKVKQLPELTETIIKEKLERIAGKT